MKRIEMKINHINKNSENYLADYLMALGIKQENIDSFVDIPKDSDEDDPALLNNMELAAKTAVEELDKPDCHVFIQVDSDTDGYTSSAVLINYLKRAFPNTKISYALHPGKEHGIVVHKVPNDATLVFIPDAGSNDYTEQRKLIAQGKKVIILDHHEINKYEDTGAILVNNQFSPNFPNKNLSGVGIVYMFIKYLDQTYFPATQIYRDYLDLTAVGIIADAMNMTSVGNNYIAYYGLNNIKNQFIKELALRQSRGVKDPDHLTKTDVAFYIAPVINGVIRSGTAEDKEIVFQALTNENSDLEYLSVWRGIQRYETLYEYAARLASNAKSRQDSAKKKSFEWLYEEIKAKGLDKDNLIIVTLDNKQSTKVSANITGLIAMELVKEFNKPCLVLRESEFEGRKVFGGSGRNGNFYGLKDLKAALHDAGAFYVEGHPNAHGAFLTPEQVPEIRTYFNEHYSADIFDDKVFEVDYWFHTGETIDMDMLFTFASCKDIWGNGLPRPVFAFDFNIDKSNIQFMGANKDSIKIKYDGIDFVSFKNPELAQKLQSLVSGHVQIVGSPNLNEWMGRSSVQIMIDDIEIQDQTALIARSIADLI